MLLLYNTMCKQGSHHQGKSGKVSENFIFLESQGKSGNLTRFLRYLDKNNCAKVRESQGKFASKSQGKSGNFVRACKWEPCVKLLCQRKSVHVCIGMKIFLTNIHKLCYFRPLPAHFLNSFLSRFSESKSDTIKMKSENQIPRLTIHDFLPS